MVGLKVINRGTETESVSGPRIPTEKDHLVGNSRVAAVSNYYCRLCLCFDSSSVYSTMMYFSPLLV